MSFHTDRQALERKYAEQLKNAENIIGGYRIFILNHPSQTEKKYTIAGTNGNYYATNDKGEFFNYLRGIL
jgi:hypothetical protein